MDEDKPLGGIKDLDKQLDKSTGAKQVKEAMVKPTLLERFGVNSLEVRYGIEFPAGATRARKRDYIRALKKAAGKKIEIGSPKFWDHMAKYGFTPIKKNEKKDS